MNTPAQLRLPSNLVSALTNSLRSENGFGQHYLDEAHPVVEFIRINAKAEQARRVFDVATGRGVVALALARDDPHRKIIAGDINTVGLSALREKAGIEELSIRPVHFDASTRFIGKELRESFDMVTAKDLFPFLSLAGTNHLITNAHALLRVGGTFIFTAPHTDSRLFQEAKPTLCQFVRRLSEEAKDFVQTKQDYFTFTNESEIEGRLLDSRFKVEEMFRFGRADGWICIRCRKT